MRRFSRAIVAIGLVTVSLAACGSDKPSIDTSKVLTKAEYITASDEICDTYGDRIVGVVSSSGGGLSLAEAKHILKTKVIPLFQAEHAELAKLKPPKADVVEMDAALLVMNQGTNTILADVDSATSIAELNGINAKGIAKWKAAAGLYGMTRCGSKAAVPSSTTTTP